MEKIINFLVIIFCSHSIFSQIKTEKQNLDTISIEIDYYKYQKFCDKSIREIYNNQKSMLKDKLSNQKDGISNLYEFNDLRFISIPTFKLKKNNFEYNLKHNFEYFINFNQDYNFQRIVVLKDEEVINYIDVPDFDFQLSKIFQNLNHSFDEIDYINKVLRVFIDSKSSSEVRLLSDIIKSNSQNTFFTIFGLNNILFEIDNKTGILYANSINSNYKFIKLEVNEYISKHIGKRKINDLMRNIYENHYNASSKKSKVKKKVYFVINKT